MEIIETKLRGLIVIKPRVFEDERGYFFESYNQSFINSLNILNNLLNKKNQLIKIIRLGLTETTLLFIYKMIKHGQTRKNTSKATNSVTTFPVHSGTVFAASMALAANAFCSSL